MAVYKPSNCVPFLSCWDLTKNQYISCEINTSNETVTGYKIKIFDNDNNMIFEGTEFSKIPETVNVETATQSYVARNTGLNGSTLMLPLIVTKNEDRNANTIYYNNGAWYSGTSATKVNDFSNNTANQPYKWQIVLAQGQIGVDGVFNQEPNAKYFDMIIDEAKILGSTGNRIQSWLSENIYKDYYIQLYDTNNEQVGVRTRISSYDHSYGFIYPQENTISQELVDSASYFKIFKDTNDPQYVSTARLVNYRLESDINKIMLKGKVPSSDFNLQGDVTTAENPYFTQVYNGDVTEDITYDTYVKTKNTSPLVQGTTFLLMYQGDTSDSPKPTYNVNNGVFAFQSATYDSKTDETMIKWLRPANFNKYADFLNRLICVQSENKNYSTSATAENLGTINLTELMFYDETAVGLYPVYEDGTKTPKVAEVILANSVIGKPQNFDGGIISSVKVKTQPAGATLVATYLGSNKYIVKVTQGQFSGSVTVNITYMEDKGEVFRNTVGKVYIRPFIGIHAEDKLFYGDNFQNNVTIKYIDNEPNSANKYNPTWYITYDGDKIFSVDEKYSIRSFFKTSDENPFYAKSSPELIVDSDQWSEEGGKYEVQNGYKICTKRYITVRGTFENRNWVNYKWILTDLTAGYIQQSEKIYRGSTEYTFYGLENEHHYLIQWVVEDEYGVVWTTDDEKNIFMTRVIINATPFPFEATYECETQSVLLNFIRDGVVIPNPSNITALYYYVYQEDSEGNKIESLERIPYKVQIENKAANSSVFYAVQGGGESTVLPYNVTYPLDGTKEGKEYYHLQISEVNPDLQFPTDRKALMEYTQTKLEESASEKGIISAPLSNDFVVNSEHILDANFCGDIIDYYIDIDDVNEQSSYIRLTLSLLPAWYTDDNGEVVAEENRNKVVLTASKKIGNVEPAKTTILPLVYKQNASGEWILANSDGRWQEDKKIVSAFVKDISNLDANLEYIETTHPYVWDDNLKKQVQNEGYANINGVGALNSATKEISFPISSTKITGESGKLPNVWTDKKLKLINQTENGNSLNVITSEDNIWRDTDENGVPYYWNDYTDGEESDLYSQILTTKNTGRQNVGNYKMTFSILVKNLNNHTSNINTILSENIKAVVFISDVSKKVGD